jgi:hypothetical protein
LEVDRDFDINNVVKPACLPEKPLDLPLMAKCYTSGWGRNETGTLKKQCSAVFVVVVVVFVVVVAAVVVVGGGGVVVVAVVVVGRLLLADFCRQPLTADFAGRLCRQTWPAEMAGRLGRQTG